jgi:hypothetical protein
MLPTTTELLRESLRFYKQNKILFWKFSLPLVLFGTAGSLIKYYFTPVLLSNPSYSLIATVAILVFITYVLTLWTVIGLIRAISAVQTGAAFNGFTREFLSSVKLVVPALLTSLLVAVVIFGGLILAIIPAIIFSVWFLFAMYAVILDRKKGVAAMRMSKNLVKGYFWEVLWLSISTSFVILMISFIVQSLIRFVFTFIGELATPLTSTMNVLIFWLPLLISFFLIPLSFLPVTLLYNELKKKRAQ